MGVVVNQATGDRYAAVRGDGAERDGHPIRALGLPGPRSAIVGISGFPGRHPGWAQYRALGAASLECCAVAEGVLDAYLVVGRSTLYGWDYLAGLLVCREVGAGGGRARRQGPGGAGCVDPAAHRRGDPDAGRSAAAKRRRCERTRPTARRARCGPARPGERSSRCTAWCTSCLRRRRRTRASASRAGAATSRRGRHPWARCRPTWWSRRSSTSTPSWCRRRSPASWEMAAPAAIVAARFAAVDAACRRLLGDEVVASAEMRRAAVLARTAAEEACRRIEGRPLAAAHADLSWPSEPHLVLWHAQSILREYRGDGHVALLVVHGLSGIEALVTHAAAGDVPAHLLRSTRGWPQDGVGRRRRRAAGTRLARAGRRAPLHRVGRTPAPADRGRHRRTGRRAVCGPR